MKRFHNSVILSPVIAAVLLFYSPSAYGASASITATVKDDGGVVVRADGSFGTCEVCSCIICDPYGDYCRDTNEGTIALFWEGYWGLEGVCGEYGYGSASCTATLDRAQLHGTHHFVAYAVNAAMGSVYFVDCNDFDRDDYYLTLDNTPTVSINSPTGTVTEPFDINVTATFKPTLQQLKGFIYIWDEYSVADYKECYELDCAYSYKERHGQPYDLPHGTYTIHAVAAGGGAEASTTATFTVDKTPTVNITSPSGTVTEPFDINVTATFKPTLNPCKGSIIVFLDGMAIDVKDCYDLSCSYSSKEKYGQQLYMPPGTYTIRAVAAAGGAEATDVKTFTVVPCDDKDKDGHYPKTEACNEGDDCNDNDPAVYPGAPEICDNKDNNCNGQTDEGLSFDSDGDRHYSIGSCKTPNDDCDDGDGARYPGAPEICDGKDNNCNGQTDEGLSFDSDGDKHYTPASCRTPNDDCDDGDTAVYPGAFEICDGKDNDCDGEVDEGCPVCEDNDKDGHYILDENCQKGDDCNDGDSTIYPGAPELCDFKDNNCDGSIDEGCYEDADKDGHYTGKGGFQYGDDCNDNDPAVYPGAAEICDNKDNNCNNIIDDIAPEACYSGPSDTEGVGICKGGTRTCTGGMWSACVGEVTPQEEICDTLDNNCDRNTDEGCDGCPVMPLLPLTDPLSIRMEEGESVILEGLTQTMQENLDCFSDEVFNAGGTLTITSAYRPSEYQMHLREVWDKYTRLMDENHSVGSACYELFNEVKEEFHRHSLLISQQPALNSRHSSGTAVDISVVLPPGTDGDTYASNCGLFRPYKQKDPVHYESWR